MLAVKETDFQDSGTFSEWFAQVFNKGPVVISGSQNRKAVMIPLDEFDELQRQRERAEYLAKLERGFAAIERGEPGVRKTMEELETMANEESGFSR